MGKGGQTCANGRVAMLLEIPGELSSTPAEPRATEESAGRYPLRRPIKWTDQRITEELSNLIGETDIWPSAATFRSAGLGGMRETLLRSSEGLAGWAARMGVTYEAEAQPWTEDRIEAALTAFLGGRTSWPTQREFIQAGQRNLMAACYNHGGHPFWAQRFGLSTRPSGRGY